MKAVYPGVDTVVEGDYAWITVPVKVVDVGANTVEIELVERVTYLEKEVCQVLDWDIDQISPTQSWRDYDPGDIVLDPRGRVFRKCSDAEANPSLGHCWIFGDIHSSEGGPEPEGKLTLLWDATRQEATTVMGDGEC